MRFIVSLAAALFVGALFGARFFSGETVQPPSVEMAADLDRAAPTLAPVQSADPWAREVRIAAAHDQQFYVRADVNRSPAQFLVDTGASYVALRDGDARAAGVYTAWADYTVPVRTANGETKAAFVTLEEMEIDGIRVEGVKAFILPDDQLSVNLLGMSFLSRIESVEASRGELVLKG